MNVRDVIECVENIVGDKAVKKLKRKNIDNVMKVPFTDKDGITRLYKLDSWNWIFLAVNYLNNINKLMEAVYYSARKIARIRDMCTGKIEFVTHKEEYYIGTTKLGFFLLNDTDNTILFLRKLHNRIQGKKICSIVVIFEKESKIGENPLELIRHANMLFIENKEAEHTLNLYLYDPHGSEPELFGQESNIFLDWLKTLYETLYAGNTVNIIERESFSCPIGIQGVIPELKMGKEGYCVTYSYFWIYLILHCSNSIPNVDLNTLISNIEKTVIGYIEDSRIFAEKIYSFSESIVSIAHDNIPDKQNYFKGLNDYMVSFIQEKMQHTPVEKLPYVDLIEDPYNLADSEEENEETRYIDTSQESRGDRKFGRADKPGDEFAGDFSSEEESEDEPEEEHIEEVSDESEEVFAPEEEIRPKRQRRIVYRVNK
jgi:hypothetical protein